VFTYYKHLHKDAIIQKYLFEIKKPKQSILINELNDESMILLIVDAFFSTNKTIFVSAPNLYKAQLIYDRLSSVLGSDMINFFPQDEFVTSEMLVSSNEFKTERINTICDLLFNTRKIVVTHTTGLVKPQMPKKTWENAILDIETGKEYEIMHLSSLLVSYGYKREYTVEKPGDFSVRGGIVDIFPLNQTRPYRLDFFGDLLEKIKTFDIDSQRSIETVNKLQIMPMYEFFYGEEELKIILSHIDKKVSENHFSNTAIEKIQQDKDSLVSHQQLDRLARYIPIMYSDKNTIVDYADDRLIFFFDYHRGLEQFDIITHEISDWYMTTDDYPKIGFEMLFHIDSIACNNRVCLDYLNHEYRSSFDTKLKVFSKETRVYEGDFSTLFEDLRSGISKTTTLIAFGTSKIRDNLVEMLDDENIPYFILSQNDDLFENAINLIVDERLFDVNVETGRLRIITETNLIKKSHTPKKSKYRSVYQNTKRVFSVNDLKPGDYVVHNDYGIGKFLEIVTMELGSTKNDYIHIEYRDGDKLYIPVDAVSQVQKYAGSEGFAPRLNKLGGTEWAKTKQRVRAKVKDIAEKLINLYALREKSEGFAFIKDDDMQEEFEADFEFEETADQLKAIEDVKRDMESIRPMDRLLCGDVGFGKTEVALRAAFKAVLSNKQVAYLAPTTVLARQHFQTFTRRMDKFGINVKLMNRFVSKKAQNQTISDIKTGRVDVVIGTHRILSKDVEFKDLGLLVIDEEQRFGVEHKERIKEMKVNVDVLSLSATPIPRTLQMAIMGVKNMSLLETAPENRYPIQTYVLERNDTIIKDAIERELARNGQIFYIYNRIDDIDIIETKIKKLVPEARVDIIHGQMNKVELEAVVSDFIDSKIDVLISTTIIETGIDIPNANTLIIHDADRLGLSQLYQIRGRVGRSNRIAYAYLMYGKNKVMTEEAEKRLMVIKEFTELGSGFKIAVRDLSIRGAGDVLGSEQSGFIDSVGVDLYMRILQEEVHRQQGLDPEIEPISKVRAKVSKYIDDKYIDDDFVKLEMHTKIKDVHSVKEINGLLEEFMDRFGRYDPNLEIYMYEKLFEYFSAKIDVEKMIESKTNITLIISEEGTKVIAGDKLFSTGMKISKYLRFAYKQDRINIILDTIQLDKHWLFTMCDFLEKIVS
jgi:transcription-repair coupling factor (superfamily II helicase)